MKVMSTTVPGPGWYALRMILNSIYGLDVVNTAWNKLTAHKPTDLEVAVHRSNNYHFGVEPPYLSGAYKVRHTIPLPRDPGATEEM